MSEAPPPKEKVNRPETAPVDEREQKQTALYASLDKVLPADIRPIQAHAANPSLTNVVFWSKDGIQVFDLETGEISHRSYMKAIAHVDHITYEDEGEIFWWCLWNGGTVTLRFPGTR
ncbi:hypothetical protein [Gemmata sp. SH-PL17]|uniref:hypothetical protein n=1 Tax=Gemmata sp. SH-PL17 TaxID=1630693 RepID=UPI000695B727|nr:hypothetical protein [Gemmata sp. SH-PL17]